MTTVSVPAKYNGPPTSGNGGYSCGVLAAFIDGPATVRLHVPPPLDTDFDVRASDEGFAMYHGDAVVGTARAATLDIDIPDAPTLETARDASTRYCCFETHGYPTCYVCGPARREDGLGIFPGPVTDWSLLAAVWEPRAEMLDAEGNVRTEIVWAALDCPGYFSAGGEDLPLALLGELTADVRHPIPGDEPLIVFAWPRGRDGRKSWGGTAIADANGNVLAVSSSLWITLKQEA